MFILDCVVSREDLFEYMKGSIFRAPAELLGQNKIEKYSRFTNAGWHKIDYDYLAYVIVASNQTRYCFIGMYPQAAAFKNTLRLPEFLREDRIIEYLKSIGSMESRFLDNVREDLNLVIHDLRRLSNVIYNAAEEAKLSLIDRGNSPNEIKLVENIIAAQSMLKIRVDMLDYTDDTGRIMTTSLIPVFKKIDKVVRSFRPAAEKQSISLYLRGSSYAASEGPEILEIVPYILIDNAVKYSPHNGTVDVTVSEGYDDIVFSVKSIGPIIEPDETELIFKRGYRGRSTNNTNESGSGLGLFLCKSIVDRFKGTITVFSGDRDISATKGICREHTFTVRLPKAIDASQQKGFF